uniref:Sprouty-related, EVH1 domain-containing protein 2 n=1 Tax=Neogobius melanostomus TaxID=47308 RepID=A0A8C6UJV0_9GOBI
IVRVKAVVMTRDDSSGGWLAQDGGALSRVGVCRLLPPELTPSLATRKATLVIFVFDRSLLVCQVILDCPLRKDLVYTIATPTFHHWKVEDRRCGLSFQSPADARAFDRGVRKAIEDLAEGAYVTPASRSAFYMEESLPHSVTEHHEQQARSQGHFLCPTTSLSSGNSPTLPQLFPSLAGRSERSWLTGYEDYRHATVRDKFIQMEDSESYVDFAKTQKDYYTYPLAPALSPSDSDPALGPLTNKGHSGSCHHGFTPVVSTQPRPYLPGSSPSTNGGKGRKPDGMDRAQCEHCGEGFYLSENQRGRCQDAPDPVRVCIRRVSCMWLADTMLYHCMSDPEGDYSDPCSCDGSEGSGGGRVGTRWLALFGLSLVAPCLCLYPPLHACHRAGLACGCCGGRHKAMS